MDPMKNACNPLSALEKKLAAGKISIYTAKKRGEEIVLSYSPSLLLKAETVTIVMRKITAISPARVSTKAGEISKNCLKE